MAKGKLALGALIGAVAGFVSGVLLAPKSGQETRNEIKKDALKLKATAEKELNEAAEKAKVVAKDVTAKAKEIKGHFEEAVEDTQKTLSNKPKTTTKKK